MNEKMGTVLKFLQKEMFFSPIKEKRNVQLSHQTPILPILVLMTSLDGQGKGKLFSPGS